MAGVDVSHPTCASYYPGVGELHQLGPYTPCIDALPDITSYITALVFRELCCDGLEVEVQGPAGLQAFAARSFHLPDRNAVLRLLTKRTMALLSTEGDV